MKHTKETNIDFEDIQYSILSAISINITILYTLSSARTQKNREPFWVKTKFTDGMATALCHDLLPSLPPKIAVLKHIY